MTRYERTLRNCARELSEFARGAEASAGAVFDEDSFREWAGSNRAEATKKAGMFVARLLVSKAANQSVGYSARLYVAAWKSYGVSVDAEVLEELSRLTREKWRPARVSRLSALSARKSDQFDLLEQHWRALVDYLGCRSGAQFAQDCRAAAQQPLATSSLTELAWLARKPEAELEAALLRTRAFISLLRATGMRSITAVSLRLEQFTEVGNSGVLLVKRMERKCGSARNTEKPVFVCLAPHADPALCVLVHISAALPRDQVVDPSAYELFGQGFAKKPHQDYVSFATMVQRRFIAILHCAALAIGAPGLFGAKKLHAIRVQCSNALGGAGASEAEREAHIGWQSTVQSRHYSSLRHTAMNARTPHLLAGRAGRDDPPHAMWLCFGQATGETYWERVRCLAAAAGYVAGADELDPLFHNVVMERVAAGNPEREDSPWYLLRRVKQLERENAALQVQVLQVKKRRRPEDAAAELKELVIDLKQAACSPDFPAQCAAALDRISALVEDASDRGSFGLAQSTAEGKVLVRILVLAALTNKHGPGALQPHSAPGRSWLAWAADAAHPLVAAISTKTWPAYKASASAAAALQGAAPPPLTLPLINLPLNLTLPATAADAQP
jgi:hypothetical protein